MRTGPCMGIVVTDLVKCITICEESNEFAESWRQWERMPGWCFVAQWMKGSRCMPAALCSVHTGSREACNHQTASQPTTLSQGQLPSRSYRLMIRKRGGAACPSSHHVSWVSLNSVVGHQCHPVCCCPPHGYAITRGCAAAPPHGYAPMAMQLQGDVLLLTWIGQVAESASTSQHMQSSACQY